MEEEIYYLRPSCKNYKISKKYFLICPNCKYKVFKEDSKIKDLVFYKTSCGNCEFEIGFIKGKVKARKLGSYIRLGDTNRQVSVNISTFGDDFDVRSKDEIILIYLLQYYEKTPVTLVNETIQELYTMTAYEYTGYSGKRKEARLMQYKNYEDKRNQEEGYGSFSPLSEKELEKINFETIEDLYIWEK